MLQLFRPILLAMVALLVAIGPARATDEQLTRLVAALVEATSSENSRPFIAVNFEKALAAKIAALDKKPNPGLLDFDILTSSQDPEYPSIKKTISTATAEPSPSSAKVTVRFKQSNRETVLVYDVRRASNAWKIHDIQYINEKFSLRRQLKVK